MTEFKILKDTEELIGSDFYLILYVEFNSTTYKIAGDHHGYIAVYDKDVDRYYEMNKNHELYQFYDDFMDYINKNLQKEFIYVSFEIRYGGRGYAIINEAFGIGAFKECMGIGGTRIHYIRQLHVYDDDDVCCDMLRNESDEKFVKYIMEEIGDLDFNSIDTYEVFTTEDYDYIRQENEEDYEDEY